MIPNPQEQATVIRNLSKQYPLEVGENQAYIISNSWLSMWEQLVGYKSTSNQILTTNVKIGPIDNNDIVINENELDPTKKEEIDFTILSPKVWNQLLHWFGGGPEISVPVYLNYKNQPTAIIHHFYIFCKYQNEDNVPFTAFNLMRLDDLLKMVRKRFKIPDEIEIRFLEVDRKKTFDLNKTIYENELHPNIKLIIDYRTVTPKTTLKWASESGFNYINTKNNNSYDTDDEEDSNQSIYDEGDSETIVKIPGVCGLRNIGNSCYFNSALQCLMHCVEFIRYFLSPTNSQEWRQHINTNNPIGAKGELVTSFVNLAHDLWSGKYVVIKPIKLKDSIDNFTNQFKGTQQQDAHELVTFLLDGIHEDLNINNFGVNGRNFNMKNRMIPSHLNLLSSNGINPEDIISANETWENHKSKNNSIIVDMFQGLLRSQIVCPFCQEMTVVFDPYMALSLPLARQHTQSTIVIFVPYNFKEQYKRFTITYTKNEQIHDLIQQKVGYKAHFIFAFRQKAGSDTTFYWGFQNSGPNIDLYALEVPYIPVQNNNFGMMQRNGSSFDRNEMANFSQNFGNQGHFHPPNQHFQYTPFQPMRQPPPPPQMTGYKQIQGHQQIPPMMQVIQTQHTPPPPQFVRIQQQSIPQFTHIQQPPPPTPMSHVQHQPIPMDQIQQIHHHQQQPPHLSQMPMNQIHQIQQQQQPPPSNPLIGHVTQVQQFAPKSTIPQMTVISTIKSQPMNHMTQVQQPPPPPMSQFHQYQQMGQQQQSSMDQIPQIRSVSSMQQMTQIPQIHPSSQPMNQIHQISQMSQIPSTMQQLPPMTQIHNQQPQMDQIHQIQMAQIHNPPQYQPQLHPSQMQFPHQYQPPQAPPPNGYTQLYQQQQQPRGGGNHLYGGCPDFVDEDQQVPKQNQQPHSSNDSSNHSTSDTKDENNENVFIACILRIKVRKENPISQDSMIVIKDASAPFLVPVDNFKITREELNSKLERYFSFLWSTEKCSENEIDPHTIKAFLRNAIYDVEETELDFTQYREDGEINPGRVMVQFPSEYYIINNENRYFKENPVINRISHIFYSVYINEDYMNEKHNFNFDMAFSHISFVNTFNNQSYSSEAISLHKCFKYFSENEVLDSRNQWFCKQCQKNVNANKKMDVWSAPKVLIIQLKRFVSTEDSIKKLDTNVSYPEILEMNDYLVGPDKNRKCTYKLFAVCEHFGGLMGGHYTAHAIVTPTTTIHGQDRYKANNYENGKWYHFNDSSVTKSSSHDAHSHNAYMLFYEKID